MTDVLRKDNYNNIIPSTNTLEEAINYIKKLYGTTEGVFARAARHYTDYRPQKLKEIYDRANLKVLA